MLLDDQIFFHCEWSVFINEVPPRLVGFSPEMGVGQSLSPPYMVLPEDPDTFFCMCAFSLEVARAFFSLKRQFFIETA